MKKLLLFLMLLPSTLFAQGAFAPLQQATRIVNGFLVPAPLATITVCAAGATGTPCAPPLTGTVFSDLALTQPKTNPFTADANGNYIFAAVAGTYTVTVTGVNVAGYSYQVTLGGSGGGSGGPVNSVFGRTGAVVATTGDYNFGQLGSGTNTTSAMLVGSGASLAATGSGTIGATTSATATALASTPSQCSSSQFAQGVATNGNANCATPTGLGIFNSANTFVLSPNCSVANTNNCFFIYADGRSVADAVTNGTMTVTSATAAFTAADTGKIGWVNCAGGANGVHDSTVTYVNSTTVTMSNASSGSSGACIMVLGHNDATNVEAAWTALTSNLNCGHLWLPGGGIVTTEPFFQSPVIPARCQTSIGEDIGLTSIFGNSHVSTVIYPSPDDFDFTACVAGCFSPNGGSNEMRDIEVSGSGYTSVNLPGAASGKSVFVICKNGNGCWWRNITINNWASLQTTSFIGLVGLGQQSEIDFLDSDSACLFNSYNFTVSQGFCVGSGNNSSVTFGANCIPNCVSRNSTWSASNQLLPSVTVLNGGTYIGYGDNIENTATARAALSLGVGSVAITNDMSISGTGGVSAEAVLFNGAGSILKARNTTFSGGATIGSFSSGSAGWGEILDGGGNTCTNCFLTYSGTLVNAPSEPSLGGACLNASGAGPEACGASSHGTVAIPTTTTSYVIDTIAAYAGMRVQLNYKTSNSGIPSTPTCVVPSTLGDIYVSSITAGTSFTLTLPSTTGIVCVDWSIQ